MFTEARKKELDEIKRWGIGAEDRAYVDMAQDVFDKCSIMKDDDEETKQHFIMLRGEGGFDKHLADMAQRIAAVDSAEELHYLVQDYNFSDGFWFLEQVIMNPACDLITAKDIYWLSDPGYYYDEYGSPADCPPNVFHAECARFLVKAESKASGEGFKTDLRLEHELIFEQPGGLDYDSEPYCRIPSAFR
jgi:hypothetical protein